MVGVLYRVWVIERDNHRSSDTSLCRVACCACGCEIKKVDYIIQVNNYIMPNP